MPQFMPHGAINCSLSARFIVLQIMNVDNIISDLLIYGYLTNTRSKE